jgi:hypothetical protein
MFLALCMFLIQCSKKINQIRLPSIEKSRIVINNYYLNYDTLGSYWDILGKNNLSISNSKNQVKFYSFYKGIELTLNGSKWDTTYFTPFNNGVLNTAIVKSDLIGDSIVYFLHKKSIWMFNVLNYKFKEIKNIESGVKSPSGSVFYNYTERFNQSSALLYCESLNKLYFPIYTFNKKEKEYLFASYNLQTDVLKIENLLRPKVDEEIHQIMQDNTMFKIKNQTLFVAFSFNKLGLRYDLISNKVDTLNFQSLNDTILQEAYTEKNTGIKNFGDRFMKTKLYNAYYGFYVYNPFKNHFYKIFYKKLDENNVQGYKNTLAEKRLVMQFYDSEMKLINELDLPENMNWLNSLLPCKEGVLLFNVSNSGNYNLPNKTLIYKIYYD